MSQLNFQSKILFIFKTKNFELLMNQKCRFNSFHNQVNSQIYGKYLSKKQS